jgi:hypothetical protein
MPDKTAESGTSEDDVAGTNEVDEGEESIVVEEDAVGAVVPFVEE